MGCFEVDEATMRVLREMEVTIKEIEKKVNLIYQAIIGTPAVPKENKSQEQTPVEESKKYGWEKEMPFDELVKKMGGSSGVLK
jgi:hypothetical protein